MTDKQYAYSEIFHSLQGEGRYTGTPGPWLRFFGCNLQCDGFGQQDPTDPSTYKLPYKELDASQYTRLEDLPIFEYGCDSSYSWSAKFKHLIHKKSVSEICDEIEESMKSQWNPDGKFFHPNTYLHQHMHFTGGEPMRPPIQKAIVEIVSEMDNRMNPFHNMTIETNGTHKASPDFYQFFTDAFRAGVRVFFSVSPKLRHVTGEVAFKAIKPDAVASYNEIGEGQLKFVVNGTEDCWWELERAVKYFRDAGVLWPVWIMPVGATREQQETDETASIVREGLARGYKISGRMHCHLLGNKIGT